MGGLATIHNMPKSPPPSSRVPLVDIVSRKAVPWAEKNGMQRLVIARASSAELVLPDGVHISPKKLVSGRKSVRGQRIYGGSSITTARWTLDDQETVRVCSLVCVVAGQADYQIGDYILHCPEGTFIFVPPGLPHPKGARSHLEGGNRAAGSCDLLWFSPRGRRIQCWMCYSRGAKHKISNGQDNVFLLDDRMVQFLDCMEEEAAALKPDYEKMLQGALVLFLVAAQRELKAGHFLQLLQQGVEEYDKPSRQQNYDPIVRAQDFIQANLAASLTIDKVAGAIHMSRAQFTRRFHAQTGYTFTEFIIQSRLEQAKIFLRDTDWSVGQICEFVGFRSTAYFHTLFRRRFDTSPIDFRISCHKTSSGGNDDEKFGAVLE
jgi:AraC-like DNA-binding protein